MTDKPPLIDALQEEKMLTKPLLVFANKQDLVGALTAAEVAESLQLLTLRDRAWQIQGCSAKDGEGLKPGMEWLIKQHKS